MAVIAHLHGLIRFLYHAEVPLVLQSIQTGAHLIWGVALALLVTKLAWSPLDKATTYGKLLFSRSSRRGASEQGRAARASTERSSSSAAANASTSKPSPSTWMNMRFAFSSSYMLGWLWVLLLLVGLLDLTIGLYGSSQFPARDPCDPLPIALLRTNTSLSGSTSPATERNSATNTQEQPSNVATDPSSSSANLASSNDPQVWPLNPYFTSTLYQQSFCSALYHWTSQGLEPLAELFSPRAAADWPLYLLSNSALFRTLLLSTILLMHLTRRSLECLFVHIFSPRSISLHNLVLMWAYYAAAPFVLLIDLAAQSTDGILHPGLYGYDMIQVVIIGVGVEVFIIGSVMQFYAHHTLAAGRTTEDGKVSHEYFVPKGGLFDYISCPHYLAELIIYASFTLIAGFTRGSLLVLLFVALTMGSQALKTHAWYRANFTKAQLGMRTAFIPFVL